MTETVKVHAYCGCFAGEPKWQYGISDWYKEPDECMWEAVIEVDKDDWEDEGVSINCPKCNAVLTQDMEHFDLVK